MGTRELSFTEDAGVCAGPAVQRGRWRACRGRSSLSERRKPQERAMWRSVYIERGRACGARGRDAEAAARRAAPCGAESA